MTGEVSEGVDKDMDVDREVYEDMEEEVCNDTVATIMMKLTNGQK